MPSFERYNARGVTLLSDPSTVASGVTFAFTERSGGVSMGPYASLNLGGSCGDDPASVAENRRRALAAIGAEQLEERLVNPRQVHGDHVVVVSSSSDESVVAAQAEARAGSDAVVCTVSDVPLLLCFADCVPVVIVAPGGVAVAHSGWRGTIVRIAATTARVLMDATGANAVELCAYIGPHVGMADYKVSPELAARFSGEFGAEVVGPDCTLDLGRAVRIALFDLGLDETQVVECQDSTASCTDRFFSYRAEGGKCGRHGALAVIGTPWQGWSLAEPAGRQVTLS